MKEHKGKIGGFFLLNTVVLTEWVALQELLSKLDNQALYIGAGLYLIQILAGLYAGHKYDMKKKRNTSQEWKSNEFALVFFDKLKALSQRNGGRITLYVFALENWRELQEQASEEQLQIALQSVEKGILSAIRKSDVVTLWEENQYVVIAADKGYEESRLAERVVAQVRQECEELLFKVDLQFGAATYPTEGYHFDVLLSLAQKRLYELQHE
ncbi:diguanylate cyclase [Ectobacillus antri]|jgi:GGDEF domain-containing protein|uniref:Diguanylate cyclase n=1 Tax=Ectobacillus antri TaxID=2486280 RepID=A0ABT6H5T1_9BACI|nr:diguanylate cyclase [Ectobacillus antri]MDG4656612.1 diguanylate cyclase [Ectobacillus antri]MDG5754025.1 diguanylate cyclase [Ectobacillus antri]